MRLFVAVPLPDNIKRHIKIIQERYRADAIRLIPEQNLHLTVHFIGEISLEKVENIRDKLKYVAGTFAPFNLSFQETSPGPKLNAPRLVWVRFQEHEGFNNLSTALCQELDASAGAYGKFIPHITIARYRKENVHPRLLPVIQNIEFPDLPVNSFSLWQSTLDSPHPKYTIIENFELTGKIG